MNAPTARVALHELRMSAGVEESVEMLAPMRQQLDLLALAEALEISTPIETEGQVEIEDRADGMDAVENQI